MDLSIGFDGHRPPPLLSAGSVCNAETVDLSSSPKVENGVGKATGTDAGAAARWGGGRPCMDTVMTDAGCPTLLGWDKL